MTLNNHWCQRRSKDTRKATRRVLSLASDVCFLRRLVVTSEFEEIYRSKGTRKQQQLAGKGTTAGSMLCFTVSMLKARLGNCAADKTL